MNKKTFFTVIITFLLTTLFWYLMMKIMHPQPIIPSESRELQQVAEGISYAVTTEPPAAQNQTPQRPAAQKQTTHRRSASAPVQEVQEAPAVAAADHSSETPVAPPAAAAPAEGVSPAAATPAAATGDLKRDIVGNWKPVLGSQKTLQITSFGKMIVKDYKYSTSYPITREYKYKIQYGKLYYTDLDKYYMDGSPIEIETLGSSTYLTIHDDADMGGKYRRQ